MAVTEKRESDRVTTSSRQSSGRQVPGPRGHAVFGSIPAFRRNVIQALLDGWHEYGDVVRFRLGGRLASYLLVHPDDVKRVLQDNHFAYHKDPFSFGKLKETIGEGLLTSEGDFWLRQRRLIQPAFHRQRIAALGGIMTDSALAMLDRWEVHARAGDEVDVAAEMMRLTLDVVAKSMFGADVVEDAAAVGRALSIILEHTNRRIQAYVDMPGTLPFPGNFRFRSAVKVLDRIVYRLIDERRRSGQESNDLLSMLLHARDADSGESMNDHQLRDEVMTIFLAGHETTAVALTWTWYLLSRHPEIARRVRIELAEVLGGRTPTVEDLPNLSYTRTVIDESMRLYPPAWIIARAPIADDEIRGYRIPAGSSIFISSYLTHRHPDFWENPEGFDPERFTPERSAGRPRYAYFPFGGGPRQCIGNGFALQEAQLILATVAQRYRLDLVPGHRVAMLPLITLRPRYGMRMTIRPIESPTARS